MKILLKLLWLALVTLVLLLLFWITKEVSTRMIVKDVVVETQQTKTPDPVALYQNAIAAPLDDLRVQFSGLNSLLEMGEGLQSLYIYKTWRTELDNRFNSIVIDFYKIAQVVPPESEKATHEKTIKAGADVLKAQELILGGVNIGDQGMINQGRAILEAIAY